MKEYPILFSTPMVQAILEGRKTQTRRVIQPQPKVINKHDFKWKNLCYSGMTEIHGGTFRLQNPYGWPGDLLWVRETFQIIPPNSIFYKADKENKVKKGWKPSIHMPKEAARIWLQIKDVRVERLQQISYADAKAEGVEYPHNFYDLWLKINGPLSWDANPWVWVVEFEVVSTTGKPEMYSSHGNLLVEPRTYGADAINMNTETKNL
jgi:hypothetical protein